MSWCTHCGAELPDNAKFCSQCGTQVSDGLHEMPKYCPSDEYVVRYQSEKQRERAEALFEQWKIVFPPDTPHMSFYDQDKHKKVMPMLIESAALGHPSAQNMLSMFYQKGMGVEQNFDEAFRWAMAAAINGVRGAQCHAGICYLYGDATEPNDDAAFYWFQKSAQNGNLTGMAFLGICYAIGIGTSKNPKLAMDWKNKVAAKDKLTATLVDKITLEVVEDYRMRNASERKS